MSRAFVKEGENDKAELPDRPISPHRNFVTEAGLAAIEAALGRFDAAHRAATDKGDGGAAAGLCGKSVTGERGARARRSSNLLLTKARHPSA
jgi:hypothetical protein